ncbi:type I restriction enzyme, S subunit [Fibrisoma limi BUZ 3]|uniref:Type I restriction enzyme, S subunit n=1 Tax=Fibrisoma limi BUZ 3 TaxID=1185876 RepID=I2GNU6_9BACT|nr:restriction endonuclease subunit S [Fibrisoma limi]CCH55574.1 type I restriction enzyme, S subunit [Fibrisoma limi BUZ 3]
MIQGTASKIRLKYAVQLRGERAEGDKDVRPYIGLEHIESGTGRLIAEVEEQGENTLIGESLCNVFKPNDVLFGKLRPYLAKTWVANFEGRCTTELLVMKPVNFEPTYLKYVFLSEDFIKAVDAMTFGSKMPRADWDSIGSQYIYYPTLEYQRAIANYLDRETAHIDSLIQAKKNLLVVLAEKRQALITQAVTQGLNPVVKLKPSGVDWLGEVPEHWEVKKLKYVADLKSGEFITAESIAEEGMYPVYGGNGLRGYTSEKTHSGQFVLIGRQGALCGNINYAYGDFWASEHAVVCRMLGNDNVTWLGELLRIMNLNQYSISAAQPGLSVEVIKNLSLPVPPIKEQTNIADYISRDLSKLDKLQMATQDSIDLLKERRSALITAAVTGQIGIVKDYVD